MFGSRRGFLARQPCVRACETPEAVDAACCSSKLLAEACVCLSHSGLCLATCRARRRALARARLCKAELGGQSRGGRFCAEPDQSEWVDSALLKLCSCKRKHEEAREHVPKPKTVSVQELFPRNAPLCRLFVGSFAAGVQIPLPDVDTSWAGIEYLWLNGDSQT